MFMKKKINKNQYFSSKQLIITLSQNLEKTQSNITKHVLCHFIHVGEAKLFNVKINKPLTGQKTGFKPPAATKLS